jgi:hypothetical protein
MTGTQDRKPPTKAQLSFIVRYAQIYTPPWPGQRLPSSLTARPAGIRKVTIPRTQNGIAAQPPVAMTDEPVIQQMMNTYTAVRPNVVSTLGRICSGTSSVVIKVSRETVLWDTGVSLAM